MQPSPATSITPFPAKKRLRRKKPLPTIPQVVAPVVSQPAPLTTTPLTATKGTKSKKGTRRVKAHSTTETPVEESTTTAEKKTSYRKKVDIVKQQIKRNVDASLKRSALQDFSKGLKTIKEHVATTKTELKA